jgi:hypothetical protein
MSLINCVLVYVYLGTYIYFGVRHSRAHYTYTHIPCMQTPERPVRRLVCIEEGRLLERKSRRRLSSRPSMTLSRLGHSRHRRRSSCPLVVVDSIFNLNIVLLVDLQLYMYPGSVYVSDQHQNKYMYSRTACSCTI